MKVYTELRLYELAIWQPENYKRILIFAPHPDDEVLAAGGVIGAAARAALPIQVRVVIVTNGDGSFSTALLNGYNPLAKRSYRYLAPARQQESLQATAALGLAPDQIQCWGFPDRGLNTIWQRHWIGAEPYRSGYSGLTHTTNTLHSPVDIPYTGSALLERIRLALTDFQPDAVILPHPCDAHPDHRNLANFIILAVALNRAEGWSSTSQLFAYIMWLSTTPCPISIRLDQASQKLPVRFTANQDEWLRFPLTKDIQEHKIVALKSYQSQIRLSRTLLRSAGAENELFSRLLQCDVGRRSTPVSLPPDEQWQSVPYQHEWSLPGIEQLLITPRALCTLADTSDLWLAAELPRTPGGGLGYLFIVRTVHGQGTHEARLRVDELLKVSDEKAYAVARLPIKRVDANEQGQVFIVSLELRMFGWATVARSRWGLFYLRPAREP